MLNNSAEELDTKARYQLTPPATAEFSRRSLSGEERWTVYAEGIQALTQTDAPPAHDESPPNDTPRAADWLDRAEKADVSKTLQSILEAAQSARMLGLTKELQKHITKADSILSVRPDEHFTSERRRLAPYKKWLQEKMSPHSEPTPIPSQSSPEIKSTTISTEVASILSEAVDVFAKLGEARMAERKNEVRTLISRAEKLVADLGKTYGQSTLDKYRKWYAEKARLEFEFSHGAQPGSALPGRLKE
ncbi:hypothetical protein Ssi02_26070 [Sinosporangium siamense]|uniref:Uncharacterized protein n=2 Tax=Sinosporangium siamense TaxID=1367973 RepID=A0A919REE5_9ACTN|nr:hypothetical protein Ssi02_26070 [Sinosporangium siamense]